MANAMHPRRYVSVEQPFEGAVRLGRRERQESHNHLCHHAHGDHFFGTEALCWTGSQRKSSCYPLRCCCHSRQIKPDYMNIRLERK